MTEGNSDSTRVKVLEYLESGVGCQGAHGPCGGGRGGGGGPGLTLGEGVSAAALGFRRAHFSLR